MVIEELELTAGERLFTMRRRLKLRQKYLAESLGLTYHEYSSMEHDKRPVVGDETLLNLEEFREFRTTQRTMKELVLEEYEKLVILRRRTGVKQVEIAHELKLSRTWLNRIERGLVDCSPLRWFWENRA
jgi:transcriptional regulator with XRE-family HTH domain